MARKSVAGVVRIPWPHQGCRGPCTCTLLAPVNWSLPLSILRLCVLWPCAFLRGTVQPRKASSAVAVKGLPSSLPERAFSSRELYLVLNINQEVLKPCCVGKKPICARGVSVATPLRPAIGWAQSGHNEIGAFRSGTVQRGHASKQTSRASLACPVTASDAA